MGGLIRSTPIFFFRCLIVGIWKKKERYIVGDLFGKFSYRYGKSEAASFLSPFRFLKSAVKLIRKTNSEKIEPEEILVYDTRKDFYKADVDYFNAIGINKIGFIFREELSNNLTVIEKIFHLFFLFLVSAVVYPLALVSHDKARPGLILLELTECQLIIKQIIQKKCQKLLVLSAYEKDISFLSYYLEKIDVKVILLPSNNPLYHFYKFVVCDTIVFAAPFHLKQYEELKQNWYIKKTDMWAPYGFQSIRTENQYPVIKKNTVGMVSSGLALRKHLGHLATNDDMDYVAETKLTDCLRSYQRSHPEVKIIVYLHPIEKRNAAHLKFSQSYYRGKFGSDVEFAPIDSPSKQWFHLCDVAIAGLSSTQMERLFGGYKTLFAPFGLLGDYFSDKRLDAVSIQTEFNFNKLVESVLSMTEKEFFKNYDLEDYHGKSYKTHVGNEY
jgi:hypothetical protein